MSDFVTEHEKWLISHMSKRKGESLRRLKEGHAYGEKLMLQQVWWPVVGNFDFLHPEYEMIDEDGNYYYLDHAYIRLPRPTNIESDSFGSHARDIDRSTFTRSLRRQNSVALDAWNILRFSIDDLKDNPEYCRRTLVKMLERCYGEDISVTRGLPLNKREVIRLALRSMKPITVEEACLCLNKKERFVRNLLHELVDEGYLEPASGKVRIHSYRFKANKWKNPGAGPGF